ncbi:hypothetical protein OBBRIDRAFT_759875 [Obba rivulosa]|uniref:Transcription factor BYE1 n=1 Tax=Obba rivulosa TaxID=1052685 RepID=A0A8E2AVE9_9APHY|nr:hypothetical protein OBBRIDRAFT_759875 [Obba rivulosa]
MTSRTTGRARPSRDAATTHNKENAKVNGEKTKGKAKPRATAKVYCFCRKPDDGTPMILCAHCKEWYHFRCIPLEERDAEDIEVYICPPCHEKTGLRSVKEWEGPEAIEEAKHSASLPALQMPANIKKEEEPDKMEDAPELPSESDAESSEDNYVAEDKGPSNGRRRPRPIPSSDSESDSVNPARASRSTKRLRRGSAVKKEPPRPTASPSPGPATQIKRRQSTASQSEIKRKRSESTSTDDPARKYCLTKLQELFRQIFLRYPFLKGEEASNDDLQPDKKQEELSDEEKEILEQKAERFASDLEQCMYELYSEPDKSGKHGVAGKYKERFRMLTFNLSKPDRVVLHMRIASGQISPKELSTMSSTDLASEETKQSIRQAEQEALQQTILKKQALPRAKITHKGLQDIEDVNGGSPRAAEREREDEEEERIERERLARLRVQTQRSSSTGQGSVPPESPIVPNTPQTPHTSQTPRWGAPPPAPTPTQMHGPQPGELMPPPPVSVARPPVTPLFVPSGSDFVGAPGESELNLADFINIDDEPMPDVSLATVEPPLTPAVTETPAPAPTAQADPSQTTPPTTGISPFAARPTGEHRPSFDLNSLWSPKVSEPTPEHQFIPQEAGQAHVYEEPKGMGESNLISEEAEDQDFDMFLGNDETEKHAESAVSDSVPAPNQPFEAQPTIWSGTLNMPLDSTLAQEVSLVARQGGGRTLGHDSPLWRTLFPSLQLRIDGRVPVDKSAAYLTQTRLNPTKELIAAAFSPAPGTDSSGFKTLMDYLVSKGRHGLVFPWGNRPKESAPGRELYIVPLFSHEPLPEYMELLDELKLPKTRNANFLVGIWILTKGKLAAPATPPPPPVPAPAPAPTTAPTPVPAIPSFDASQLQNLFPALTGSFAPSSVASGSSTIPAPVPITTAPNPALVAEVASLTPEQIQAMLRALQSSALSPPQSTQQSPPAPPVSVPMTAIPLQPWTNPTPAFLPPYPTANSFASQAQAPPPRQYPDMPYNGYDQGGPYPPGGAHFEGGGDRGYRGRGAGGRGRGGRGRDRDRSRDTGWPKSRGRGRGGGHASPPRGGGGARWG